MCSLDFDADGLVPFIKQINEQVSTWYPDINKIHYSLFHIAIMYIIPHNSSFVGVIERVH